MSVGWVREVVEFGAETSPGGFRVMSNFPGQQSDEEFGPAHVLLVGRESPGSVRGLLLGRVVPLREPLRPYGTSPPAERGERRACCWAANMSCSAVCAASTMWLSCSGLNDSPSAVP